MVRDIKEFTLPIHEGAYETWPRKTKLFHNGEYTGTKIPGYVIERQFEMGNFYLIITSQDCDLEESNDFILLNDNYKVIGKETLCQAYNTYLLLEHKCINDHEILLKYMGDLYIKISLFPEERGLIPNRMKYEQTTTFT